MGKDLLAANATSRCRIPVCVALICAVVLRAADAARAAGAKQSQSAQTERIQQAQEWATEGNALFAQGKIAAASAMFAKVYAEFPDNPEVDFNYGMTLEVLGDYRRAIEPLEKAVAANPKDVQALLDLGNSYLGANRVQEGIARLGQARALQPGNINVLFGLAVAYLKLKNKDKFVSTIQQMAQQQPDNPLTYLYMARALRMGHDYPHAIQAISRAIAGAPNMAEAYFERGWIEKEQDHFDDAEKSFAKAIELGSDVAKYNLVMGQLFLLSRHDVKGAIPYLQRAVQLDPDGAEGLLDLGDAYLQDRQVAAAEQALQRAVEINPSEKRSHLLLAKAYQRDGKKDGAAKEFAIVQKLTAEEEGKRPQPQLAPGSN